MSIASRMLAILMLATTSTMTTLCQSAFLKVRRPGNQKEKVYDRDTANTHVAVQKIDIKELEQQARAEQIIKAVVTAQAFKFSDDAYRTMCLEEHPIYRAELNEEGKVIFDEFGHAVLHKLSPEEKASMQAGSGGHWGQWYF